MKNITILGKVRNIFNNAMVETEPSENATVTGPDIAGNKYVWIIGAIILLVAGWFGLQAIFGASENFKLSLVDAPKEVAAGSVATFTWRIDGSAATIHHTSVHLGTTSQLGEFGREVKPEETKYTEFVRDFASGDYNIPLQFVGNISMTTPGKYYFRVHANIKDKNYWTDEYSLDVLVPDNTITLMNAPKEATANQVFTITWRIDGPPSTIHHTSIHYGTESNPGALGKEVKPDDTKYTDLVKDFTKGDYSIPLQFVGNSKVAASGTYYFRAHAIINDKNYWTNEQILEVKAAPETKTKAKTVTPTPVISPALSPEPTE